MACSKFISVKNMSSGFQGEYAKCCVMKVSKYVADRIITKILFGITSDKKDEESIKQYAMGLGMSPTSFEKYFNEHEIKSIHKNPSDFYYFDQTLKFKFIRLFMDLNYNSDEYKSFRNRIFTQLDQLKNVRNNNLCHNRETLTVPQYHELAHSMKDPLVDLIKEIKNTWDGSIDISCEEKNIETLINKIMRDPLNDDEFAYMLLQVVIKFVAEPIIYTITKLICYDKKVDNYEKYLLDRFITKSKYKDIFCSEEKTQLRRKSWEMNQDLKLCSKIIMVGKNKHYKLNKKTEGELNTIIGSTRDIRNGIYHKMLSMTTEECMREAKNLGNCLRKLGEFARKLGLYEGLDVIEIDIRQIDVDINEIMSSSQSHFRKCVAHTC